MKRVLVTGATGFIGRHALEPLRQRGFDVHTASRRGENPDGVTAHAVDLLDPAASRDLVVRLRPTHLLHLAWYVEHGRFWTAPENELWVSATVSLVGAFADAGGRRAVLAGTCAEYDWSLGWCDERETPLAPRSLYAQCKDRTRAKVEALCAQRGVEFAWGRIFHLYGPGEHPQRLVASVIRALLAGEEARCTSGVQQRDFLHVADVAGAFVALLDSPVTGAVNIASGVPVTLAEVVKQIARQIGREDLLRLGALPDRPDDPPALLARTQRLQDEVRWHPGFDLAAGLADAIACRRKSFGT